MEGENTFSTPSEGHKDGIQRMRPAHGRTSGPARRSTRGQWTAEEDEILRKAVQMFKGKNWKKIAERFKDRTDVQCLHRWQKVLNPELLKGPWSKEEDEIIIQLVHRYGPKKWSTIAQHLPGRIGKQCRERWHNHLNPSINKEAWTQEEELVLIRAHQVYGNRWAELTKFLPGRTDNGIKNHWHSSVKKKLESYLASGLLEQYQALPLVPYQHDSVLSSSIRMQRIGDESSCRIGAETEEEPECSSSMVCCSQSSSDMPSGIINTAEHLLPSDMPYRMEQSTFAAYCPDQNYCPPLEDITFSVPEVPCEMEDSSKFPYQKFSQDVGTSSCKDYQFSLQELPDIASLALEHDSPGFQIVCTDATEGHQFTKVPVETSTGLGPSTSDSNIDVAHSGVLTQGPNVVHSEDYQHSLTFPTSDNQIPDSLTSALQTCPSRSNALETTCSETLRPFPLRISAHKRITESTQLICHPFEAEPMSNTNPQDGFIQVNNSANFSCDDNGANNSSLEEQSFHINDSKKLVPVNDFASQPEVKPATTADKEQPEDAGALCSESTRFPSLDIPFVSCDLIHLKSDVQQDFSPLGIRKLLMSSMTCMSPLRLWDSPSRDCSPKAVLKSGAKPFAGTSSILKKRNRDLLSPLSERRSDKKLETDITPGLAKDFSHLDVLFDESENQKSSLQLPSSILKNISSDSSDDKEYQDHASNGVFQGSERDNSSFSNDKAPENKSIGNDYSTAAAKNLCGVLVEYKNKDPLLSPEKSGSKVDAAQISSTETRDKTIDNAASNPGGENLSIFCGTPFIRGLESPSAWKSPLFINTLLPSPRFDPGITIEDIGYLLSPGDRSYDALGLIKQLSEQTEVLENNASDDDKENAHVPQNHQLENHPHRLASNVLAERRVLDFSDCWSPGKGTEMVKASTSKSILKGCR